MESVEASVGKLLTKFADTKKKAANGSVFTVLGEHVFSLVEQGVDLSLAALIDSLQQQVDGSPSAIGQGDPDQDLHRMSAEVAIESLQTRKLPPSPLLRRRMLAT